LPKVHKQKGISQKASNYEPMTYSIANAYSDSSYIYSIDFQIRTKEKK